ncbi:IS66 family insertion sequence element accessory protein TnpB [Bradyrhizobium sp. BWC-3-1]|uniref:IS66 family insertion sequence element accessory protein TnpB n=1 Tax=Bradyrhizobium sp. BWC-3-1 TaxID=3080012 RepID=UPI00293F16DD|nr:IS66 family insertion sequence element accessory protein TnpB [Bradyrhizobium sp. BWC-3-1]WOH57717.1 IS66 family insertion sequence element accessory protein TnpB [Bradyrhizobium sp. BWC-3-1]
MALVRDRGADPFIGALYIFRSKRSDKMKMVWWDGSGVCLFAKTLEETQFCWRKVASTRVRLNQAQLLALIDGLDWTKVRPVGVKRPQTVG